MDVTFEEAWGRKDPAQAEEAKAFWEAHGLLPPAQRDQRARELVTLVRADDKLVGLSTAVIQYFQELRGRFAFYRCALAPEVRSPDLMGALTFRAFDCIGRWSAANPGEKVLGIITIVAEQDFGDDALRPMWPEHDLHLNLVGYTQQNQQIRVAWFKHARIGGEPPKPSMEENPGEEGRRWAV